MSSWLWEDSPLPPSYSVMDGGVWMEPSKICLCLITSLPQLWLTHGKLSRNQTYIYHTGVVQSLIQTVLPHLCRSNINTDLSGSLHYFFTKDKYHGTILFVATTEYLDTGLLQHFFTTEKYVAINLKLAYNLFFNLPGIAPSLYVSYISHSEC